MCKVLIIITTAFAPYGGLTTVMMNYYRAMDKSGLQIDFASTNEPEKILLDELSESGSRYFNLGSRKKNPFHYGKRLADVLDRNNYDVVHVNGNSSTMALEFYIAKKKDVPKRIAHGHTSQSGYKGIGILHRILRAIFLRLCTDRLTVSDKAGKWLYGDSFTVINNAIDVEKYKFDKETRESYRRLLGVGNRFVIGHVGKLYMPKNHIFLLKVFAEVKEKNHDALLLLVGGGELEAELREQCRSLGIENDVIFAGMVSNPQDYLQVMDVFVFPSLYEGLGLALIEAQANGLPCVVSDVVSHEATFATNVVRKPVDEGVGAWVDEIQKIMHLGFQRNKNAPNDVSFHGYNIKEEAFVLRNLYIS